MLRHQHRSSMLRAAKQASRCLLTNTDEDCCADLLANLPQPHPSFTQLDGGSGRAANFSEQFGRTLEHFFSRFLIICDPHLDFFKVVDLEISCLGSRSLIPELEYVSSYGPDTFRVKPQYLGETLVFG